jgi:ABC-type nitrate/sulfonate/bicarbonate transport system ATPase subunit
VAEAWDNGAWKLHAENPKIDFVAPVEGCLGWIDTFAIPAKAENVDAAYAWINFMLTPENAALFTTQEKTPTASKGAAQFVDPSVRVDFERSFRPPSSTTSNGIRRFRPPWRRWRARSWTRSRPRTNLASCVSPEARRVRADARAGRSPGRGGPKRPRAVRRPPFPQRRGPMDIDLRVTRCTKTFGTFRAVDDVTFDVPAGSFFSILGPSGCGKTTLLRMVAGFEEPDSGTIAIRGRDMRGVPPNRRPANLVFQHLALFPMMTVAGNIAFGLKRRKVDAKEIARRTGDILDRVGLPGYGDKRVDQLSGGQRQRVAIARCLVLEPLVLLLDEPLGALDLKLREQMKVELKKLQAKVGTTFVYITHDQSEALVMSDAVAVMNKGRFEQTGSPRTSTAPRKRPSWPGSWAKTTSGPAGWKLPTRGARSSAPTRASCSPSAPGPP